MADYVLRVNDLDVEYHTDAGVVRAANNVTFDLKPGDKLGLVGESGSGKSTTALAILGMIKRPGRIAGGQIMLGDRDLTKLTAEQMRRVRGNEISMVPQGAMNSLNPVMRIEDQLIDAMTDHDLNLSKKEMRERAHEALHAVDLNPKIGRSYPHELSGGMKQRACIAIAIVMTPKVIIADEPTSALDVVTQRQVMQTIENIQDQMGSAVILIGHDMGLMAQFASRMAVMYAGRMMELGDKRDVFTEALHPYTRALISSLPVLENKGDFHSLPGITPSLLDLPSGCVFHTRCPEAFPACSQQVPRFLEHRPDQQAACLLYEEAGADQPELAAVGLS